MILSRISVDYFWLWSWKRFSLIIFYKLRKEFSGKSESEVCYSFIIFILWKYISLKKMKFIIMNTFRPNKILTLSKFKSKFHQKEEGKIGRSDSIDDYISKILLDKYFLSETVIKVIFIIRFLQKSRTLIIGLE